MAGNTEYGTKQDEVIDVRTLEWGETFCRPRPTIDAEWRERAKTRLADLFRMIEATHAPRRSESEDEPWR